MEKYTKFGLKKCFLLDIYSIFSVYSVSIHFSKEINIKMNRFLICFVFVKENPKREGGRGKTIDYNRGGENYTDERSRI
jgi:hypothetical protein